MRQTRKDSLRLLRLSGFKRAELSVLYVGERRMRGLNLRFRGIDRPTDVLSFSMLEGRALKHPGTSEMLGDIVICPSVAARNAHREGMDVDEELRLLLVHGFLHLLGHDHVGGGREEARMRKKEAEFLDALKEMA